MGERLINEVFEKAVFSDTSDDKYKDKLLKDSIWKKEIKVLTCQLSKYIFVLLNDISTVLKH